MFESLKRGNESEDDASNRKCEKYHETQGIQNSRETWVISEQTKKNKLTSHYR